jgi:hypothetical protein
MKPAFQAMGFASRDLFEEDWPFLFAERHDDTSRPTVLGYGHGDVIRGLADGWDKGFSSWNLTEDGGRWYGRGIADNRGQHSINIAALRGVLETRGKLGFNAKYLIEMGEEKGSPGLRALAGLASWQWRSTCSLSSRTRIRGREQTSRISAKWSLPAQENQKLPETASRWRPGGDLELTKSLPVKRSDHKT